MSMEQAVIVAFLASSTLVACERASTAPVSPKSANVSAAAMTAKATSKAESSVPLSLPRLSHVSDPSTVCMVNNQYMRAPQIPVAVEGKTYFGCCEMCKGRLQRDPAARTATDPVTGAMVDKASAFIGSDEQNKVFYFENEASFRRYSGGMTKKLEGT